MRPILNGFGLFRWILRRLFEKKISKMRAWPTRISLDSPSPRHTLRSPFCRQSYSSLNSQPQGVHSAYLSADGPTLRLTVSRQAYSHRRGASSVRILFDRLVLPPAGTAETSLEFQRWDLGPPFPEVPVGTKPVEANEHQGDATASCHLRGCHCYPRTQLDSVCNRTILFEQHRRASRFFRVLGL